MTKDYEVIVRVKNARMLRKMREYGIETAAELARRVGSTPVEIGDLLNLKAVALNKRGELRGIVDRICAVLRCLPEDIIPPQHFKDPLAKNKASFEASLDEIEEITSAFRANHILPDEVIERTQALSALQNALSVIPERDRKIVDLRFGLTDGEPKTLREIGDAYGIGCARVRQIESKVLRKLRNPSAGLREAYDTLNAP